MKQHIIFCPLAVVLMSLVACKKSGLISVDCNSIDKFKSGLGIINTSAKSLGDVLLVDTSSKTVFRLANLGAAKATIRSEFTRDSTVMLSNNSFSFQLSGDISKASAQVKAEIQSRIQNNTAFNLTNSLRKDLDSATDDLKKASSENSGKYIEPLQENPHTIIAVITSMTYADKFEFLMKNDAQAKLAANTLTIGNYELNVDYNCQNNAKIKGRQFGIFYKVTFYRLAADRLVLFSKSINLNEYDMASYSIE